MSGKYTLPMGRDEIKTYLPHREPILLVDRVISMSDQSITTEIDLSNHANLFQGHFPDRAILPGVYMIEMAAQAGALLVAAEVGLDEGKFIGFSGVDNVKFKRPVVPGESLRIEVEIVRIKKPFFKFSGKLFVDYKVAAMLDFAAAQMSF